MRTGGHYFAPVGYGQDENGKLSETTFAYHDSAGADQGKQVDHYYDWLVPKEYECLGRLSDACVRDKQVEEHEANERIRVLKGMMVIRL